MQQMPFAMPERLQSDIIVNLDTISAAPDASAYNGLFAAMQCDINDVEQMAQSIRSVLRDCDDLLESEGIRYQMETLERCVDYYRRGVLAAKIMTEFGEGWLQDMQVRLRQALDEQHRWDGEGGNYLSEKGRTGMEPPIGKLTRANDRVEKAIGSINHYFPKPDSGMSGAAGQTRH